MNAKRQPSVASLFLESTTSRFRGEYLPRVAQAVETLPEGDLWWRPHSRTNSVGNLLLHLEGNVRQWILSGIGRASDHRDRASEFAATEGLDRKALVTQLRGTVEAACAIIESLDKRSLKRSYAIQGNEVTGLEAIYHVLEHFGWHTGQITWIAKERAGEKHGLAFYRDADLDGVRNQRESVPR